MSTIQSKLNLNESMQIFTHESYQRLIFVAEDLVTSGTIMFVPMKDRVGFASKTGAV
jgi:hypothetical protein